jgi:hypothetical protein
MFYLTVSLLPLVLYALKGVSLRGDCPVCHLPIEMSLDIVAWAKVNPQFVVPWAMFVALIYPVWQWWEVSAFDRWCKGRPKDDVTAMRQEFDRYTKLAENFWKAVWAIYTVAGLLGIAINKS